MEKGGPHPNFLSLSLTSSAHPPDSWLMSTSWARRILLPQSPAAMDRTLPSPYFVRRWRGVKIRSLNRKLRQSWKRVFSCCFIVMHGAWIRRASNTSIVVIWLTEPQYQIAKVTENGVSISESMTLKTSWSFAEGIRGYGAQTQ